MREYYLAVDIGASGGRHILGWLDENGLLKTKEVYRFPNGLRKVNGHLCWDLPELFRQILEGLQMCGELGMIPSYMGIDTWAVDFVLLDEWGMVLGDTVGYRDNRTQGMERYIYDKIPEQDLYARTGIQKQPFNTIYQMEAVRRKQPGLMRRAKRMLMIPDYFHYLLTGGMAAEYTNATTTQLVSPVTKDWDWDLIDTLGYSRDLFCPIRTPGSILGTLRPEHKARLGFDVQVILPPTHDTASAVLAVPSPGEIPLYISSGTWSLMGTELRHADCSARSQPAFERAIPQLGGKLRRDRAGAGTGGGRLLSSAAHRGGRLPGRLLKRADQRRHRETGAGGPGGGHRHRQHFGPDAGPGRL